MLKTSATPQALRFACAKVSANVLPSEYPCQRSSKLLADIHSPRHKNVMPRRLFLYSFLRINSLLLEGYPERDQAVVHT